MQKLAIIVLIAIFGCRYEPEFTFPDATEKVIKKNEISLIDNDPLEVEDNGWVFEVSDERSTSIFTGEWSNEASNSGQHSLMIERLVPTQQVSDGYYDYAFWSYSIKDVAIPFNADITILSQIRLEGVRGTGVSLIIYLKKNGERVSFSESGWINGNGTIQDFQSFGCLYGGFQTPADEIEFQLRMEPLTVGRVFFDDITARINY